MSRYSIEGYLIALRNRSTHTVCVEGKDDRLVIKHCLLRLIGERDHLNERYVVDSMDIIKSDGDTPGNSDKLRKICALLNGSLTTSKVTALVDRAYNWFDIGKSEIDLSPYHQSYSEHLHYTRGHSIENYFFESEYFIQYIEFNYASSLTANHQRLIKLNWESLLASVASLTFAIHENNCCKKAKGLFSLNHWQDTGEGRLEIEATAVKNSLSTRGISHIQSTDIIERASSLKTIFENRIIASRWIIHGHVGMDLLCGAIGRIMAICGVNPTTCETLNGFSETKLKYFTSRWFDRAKSSDDLFPQKFFNKILLAIEN